MPSRPKRFRSGPFRGMRHNWRTPPHEEYAYLIANMLPVAGNRPGALVAVPPPERSTFTTGRVQWVGGFRYTGSAEPDNIAVISGELWSATPSDTTWTKVVTTANLTTASITLASTGNVHVVQFGSLLVISDGVNTPFTWDGTSGAGGLTKLTNAPVFFGRPTIYYGKLFAIKDTERDTIVWSEENDATTGYEAGGFNNAWTLSQSGVGNLVAILGTNAALYYARETSIGSIRGAVTSDFTAAGVHDDISLEVGVGYTESLILVDQTPWLADKYGRPWAIVGGAVVPVWQNVADAFTQIASDYAELSIDPSPSEIVWLSTNRLVVFHWPFVGFAIFDAETRDALCFFRPPEGTTGVAGVAIRVGQIASLQSGFRGGAIANVFGDHLGLGYSGSGDGVTFAIDYWPPPVGSADVYPTWSNGGSTDALALVVTPSFGRDSDVAYHFTDLTAEHYVGRDSLSVTAANVTISLGDGSTFDPSTSLTGTPTSLATLGTATVAFSSAERTHTRTTWGLKRESRELMVAVRSNNSLTQWGPLGVSTITVVGYPVPAHPNVT